MLGNKPKLTLGLKKKTATIQSQPTTNEPEKLTLKLRKKPADIYPSQSGAKNREGASSSSFVSSLRQKPEFKPQGVTEKRVYTPQTSTIRMPRTPGKFEINIKISELPNWVEPVKRGWQRFCVNADKQVVQMMVRPKVWNKLLKANEEYPMWVASFTGKMGPRIKNGFELLEPAMQVYEKQAKKSNVAETGVANPGSNE